MRHVHFNRFDWKVFFAKIKSKKLLKKTPVLFTSYLIQSSTQAKDVPVLLIYIIILLFSSKISQLHGRTQMKSSKTEKNKRRDMNRTIRTFFFLWIKQNIFVLSCCCFWSTNNVFFFCRRWRVYIFGYHCSFCSLTFFFIYDFSSTSSSVVLVSSYFFFFNHKASIGNGIAFRRQKMWHTIKENYIFPNLLLNDIGAHVFRT